MWLSQIVTVMNVRIVRLKMADFIVIVINVQDALNFHINIVRFVNVVLSQIIRVNCFVRRDVPGQLTTDDQAQDDEAIFNETLDAGDCTIQQCQKYF